jgi:ABC-type phosphate transport system substrate-binding protein
MSVRKTSARLGLATAAVAGLVLTVLAPANADTVPGQGGVPGTYTLGTTVIGVGSDTIQWVDDKLSADYDATNPTVNWANFDACLGNTTAGAPGLGDNPDGSGFPCGADHSGTQAGVKRDESVVDPAAPGTHNLPSGSGDGRNLLQTPSDALFNDVAYGRSSGPLNAADINAGLQALPFAVDKIVVATHPGGPAPASLTGEQVLKIFNGTYTNWNQVGGKNAQIHAYIPKSGSSTRNAFLAFLAGLDGKSEPPGTDSDPDSHSAAHDKWQGPGVTITDANWKTGLANVEEHDPSVLIADPKAIEPFSYGRAQLANGGSQTVRIEGGWSADRELYHVVRGKKIANAAFTPFIYGDSNPAAPANGAGQPLTDAGGFLEAIFSNNGWVCKDPTALSDIANAGFWPLPSGDKTGNCGVANNTQNDTILPGTSAGVNEGAATQTNAFFFGGAVHVSVTSNSATPTGSVQVVVANPSTPTGSPAASFHKTVALDADGKATVTLPTTVSGTKRFDVAYLPTDFGANSSAGGHEALGSSYSEFTDKVPASKIATTVKATPKPATLLNAKANSKVTVTVKQASGSAKPTGTVNIMKGRKKVGTGTLKGGVVTITVKGSSLTVGKNTLAVKYVPTGNFSAPKTAPTITITRKK